MRSPTTYTILVQVSLWRKWFYFCSLYTLYSRSNLTWLYPFLVQGLIHISSKRSLIHPILMVRLIHSIASKAPSRVLQLQQLHGLVNQVGLTTVAVTLLPMRSCLVSGKWGQNYNKNLQLFLCGFLSPGMSKQVLGSAWDGISLWYKNILQTVIDRWQLWST